MPNKNKKIKNFKKIGFTLIAFFILAGLSFTFWRIKTTQTKATPQDLTWGVLAINTDKPIYNPGEKALLDIAVLGPNSEIICDADLKLKITHRTSLGKIKETKISTEKREIKVNPECYVHDQTNRPDYEAYYQTEEPGIYQIELGAQTKLGLHFIKTSFEVKKSNPFNIQRKISTRIYPPKDYSAAIKITASEDWQGTISEKIPENFKISPSLDYPSYNRINYDSANVKSINWQVNLKKGEETTLGYRFTAPQKVPEFYTLGPLQIGNFTEPRSWQLAADAIVASDIITMWPSTNASIPTGWTRKTELDGYFIESGIGSGSTNPESNVALGNANHSHTSPAHSHTIGHTHTVPSLALLNVSTNSGTSTGAARDTHTHASGASATSSISVGNTAGVNNTGVWNTAPNNPPATSVIFIKSNGTNKIASGAWAFFNNTAPSGWARANDDRYIKGADTGGDGGSTSGTVSHSHTDSGHTHTEAAHTHSGYSPAASNVQSTGGAGTTYAPYAHSHLVTSSSVVATEVSGVAIGATNNGEPLFIKVNTVQNNTGGEDLPDNTIAIWTGTTGSIPTNWYLCDGTNSTPNLNTGRFIKSADADINIGTTGGNSTHTHIAGASHTHTINNHTHSWTAGGNTGTGVGAATSTRNTNVQGHTHTVANSATSGGNTGNAAVTADANADNRPLYKNVYLIQYHTPKINVSGITDVTSGTVALAINGNLQIGNTAAISGGAWSISNVVEPSANDVITVWIDGALTADESTAITKYDGTGDSTGLILNNHVLSIGSSDTSPSLTVTNLGLYDNDSNASIMHSANTSILNVDDDNAYSDEKIDILSGATLTISGSETLTTHDVVINGTLASDGNSTYNVSGSWDNNAAFTCTSTCSSSIVTFTASTGTEIIDSTGASTATFNNLTLGQTSGTATWNLSSALDVNGNLTIDYGTLAMNGSNNINLAGNLTIGNSYSFNRGNYTKSTGTFTFDGTGTSTWANVNSVISDLGTVVVDGTSKIINLNSNNASATTITIGANDTLGIANDTLTILGSGDPLVITAGGIFNTTNSTVIFAGTTATNVNTVSYNNLSLTPVSGTPTFSLTGNLTGGTAMSGNLTISTGATLDVTASNYGIGLSGNWSNTGTFIPQVGAVRFGKNSGTQTINNNSSSFFDVFNSGASTIQLDTNSIDINGSFNLDAGIFNANGLNQNFAGSFYLASGTTYIKGGTLTFDGSVDASIVDNTVGQQDLGAVIINGNPRGLYSDTNLKLTTLNIGADDTLNIDSDTLTILGSGTPFVITAGGIFTTTGSTVIYAGTTATNITTTPYNNLTVDPASGTPVYSLTGHLTTTNALTGNLTISSDGSLDTTASNYGITLAGNWSNSGTFTPQASTVTFSQSSTTQTVNNNSSTFWHVTHSGAGTMQLLTNGINIDGNFSQTAGAFQANSLNQNYAGTFSLSNGTTYAKGGTLTFDGSGSSAISDATAGLQDLGAVVVNGTTKTITTSTNLKLTTLNIGADDTLNIDSDTLTILGSGTPFVITAGGTFTTTGSTVIYAGTSATNVTNAVYNNLTFTPASGTPTFSLAGNLTGSSAMSGNLTINTGATLDTVLGSNYGLTLAGNWDNNGTFTARSGIVTFNASATGKTIEAGSSAFYDLIFNSSSGGWTIQTDNLTTNRNLTITDVSSLAVEAGRTVEVKGTYSIADAETAATTWNAGSVLYLNSASAYTVGSKTQSAESYATLQIGASTNIRTWNSTATTFTVNATGSLYSQDHANVNGDLYIWGDYHTLNAESANNDYWSYNTDFDGADISGTPRQVDVRIDPSASVTVDSGDTLAAIGLTGANRTTVSRQGASNGYNLISAAGGTINLQYVNFDYLDGNKGLDIQASSTVTSLDYTKFDNLVGTAGTDDAFVTVASSVIGSGTKTITGVQFDNTGSGADFNVNRTGASDTGYWNFSTSTGTFDGEAYDGAAGVNEADPGMLRWDDSNKYPTAPTALLTEGSTNPTNVTDETPEFSAIYNDLDIGDTANAYQIQVDDDPAFGSILWDSTKTSLSPNCVQGSRCADISYAGSALTHGTQYYWQIRYWDDGDLESPWSTGSNYFIINNAPSSPTSLLTEGLTNPSAIHDTTPEFSAIYNDALDVGDTANAYQIQVDDDSGFGSPIWDSTKTSLSPNCVQGNRCTDISYAGSALTEGVTYYWQIKYWDDGDSEGAWSTGSNYFSLSQTPTAPTALLTEGLTNPTHISDTTPEFSAIYNDLDVGDTANAYQIQVDDDSGFGSPIWDSAKTSLVPNCLQSNRCTDISYAGSALAEGTQYYWRIKYWDDGNLGGTWNTGSNYFIINQTPTAPTSLLTEGLTNPANITDETPEFSAIYNDLDVGDTANGYQIQVDDNSGFGSPIWDSAQQSMINCLQGNRCQDISYAGSALVHGTQYYWRIKYWDDGGFGGAWSTGSNYFIINNVPLVPTNLWVENQTNPSAIHDTTPEFSAIFNDTDTNDISNFYRIQVDDDPAFGSILWDSTQTALSPTCNRGNRCTDISYAGSALTEGITYYWQIKYWDDGGLEGPWSTGSNYFSLSQTPTAPTSLLTEGTINPVNVVDATPEFSAIYNDLDIGDTTNAYQIQVDDDSGFSSPIWDSAKTSLVPNCLQGNRCTDISYAGSALTEGIQYYWRIKYWDDGNFEGVWSIESAYFIINSGPLSPTSLLTEGATNPINVVDATPEFSAIYNDTNTSDIANGYQIQVDDDSGFGSPIWDSGQQVMVNCSQGARCADISYSGSTLNEGTQYYWQIKYWDDGGLEGAWSTGSNYFIINNNPLAPSSLLTEGRTNPNDIIDATPEFSALYNDSNASDIANKYQIQVDDDSGFGSPLWDSGASGTSMVNCSQGARCADISYAGSALAEGTQYYWRIKYWDDGGLEGAWSIESAYFMIDIAPTEPTSLLTEDQTNPLNIPSTLTPGFSAIYNDPDIGDIANKYQIQVDVDPAFSSPIWDSGQKPISSCTQGNRCEKITYSGSTLSQETTYYWRIKYWDDSGKEGSWSTESAYFSILIVNNIMVDDLQLDGMIIDPNW